MDRSFPFPAICVFRGGENEVAINLIVQHVQTQLTARGFKLRYVGVSLNKSAPWSEWTHVTGINLVFDSPFNSM